MSLGLNASLLLVCATSILLYVISGSRSKLYFLYFLSYVPFVTLNSEAGGLETEAGLSGTIVLMKMAVRLATGSGFLLAFVFSRKSAQHLMRPQYFPVVFFVCWAMLGLHRAQAPWVSFFRLGELFTFFLIGLTLYNKVSHALPVRKVVRWHCMALSPLCAVAGLFVLIDPDIALHTGEDGSVRIGHQLMNANVLGFAAAVTCLWSMFELKEGRERIRGPFFERFFPALALVGSFLVVVFARSRTASITLALGTFLMWVVFTREKRKYLSLVLVAVILGAFFAAANLDALTSWFMRGDDLETLKSGTGRTALWHTLITEQAPKFPLLGSGYLMLSEHGRFEHHGAHWNNAHNTFVFALVATGIPGMLAVLSIVLWPLVRAFRMIGRVREEDRGSWIFLFILQVVVGVTSITGFGVSGHPNVAMLFHYALFSYVVTAPLPDRPRPKLGEVEPAGELAAWPG